MFYITLSCGAYIGDDSLSLVALVFFYNGVPVFSLSFYVLKLVSAVHFNESANTALLKCTEANSVCVCFSVTGLDVRKYGNAELRVRATKLIQIKVIFLPSRRKMCFSTTRGVCLDFFS